MRNCERGAQHGDEGFSNGTSFESPKCGSGKPARQSDNFLYANFTDREKCHAYRYD